MNDTAAASNRLAPSAAPRAPLRPSRWVSFVDQATASLPVVLMALLAGGTYWLVKNTPVADAPRAQTAPRHEPDYTMERFSVQHFTPAGRPRTYLEGKEMRHYPDTDILEIDEVRVRTVDEQGRPLVATARRALANGDGSEVQLIGGARVVREASGPPGSPQAQRLEFEGEFLHLFPDQERVQSHLPVVLRQGAMQVSGQSMKYNHLDRVLELQGQVRGTLPARTGGSAP